MKMLTRRGRWLVLAVAGALVAAPDVGARQGLTADDLFDNSVLHDVHLFVNSRDFALLQERYRTNDYFPADLEWRGLRVRNVAIRSRGHGSRDRRKLGLRVDFNKYTDGTTVSRPRLARPGQPLSGPVHDSGERRDVDVPPRRADRAA